MLKSISDTDNTIKTLDLEIYSCAYLYFFLQGWYIVSHSVVTAHPSPFLSLHILVLSIVGDSCLVDWGCWESSLLMESKHLLCVPFKSTTRICLQFSSANQSSQETLLLLQNRLYELCIHIDKADQNIHTILKTSTNGRDSFEKQNKTTLDSSHFQLCHHPHVEEMFI